MRLFHLACVSAIGLTLSACSLDNLLNGDDPPEGTTVDPKDVATYQGAVRVYNDARGALLDAMNNVTEDIATFTDEQTIAFDVGTDRIFMDARMPSASRLEPGITSYYGYTKLQSLRVRSAQAAELLRKYGTPASAPLIGHAYAMKAYATLLLAEMFCSGVPLTEVPFERDFQYTAALPTDTLLARAIALFDTAYQYGKDSLPIATFARVGKARALLSLGKYADAAAAVADVPTNSVYQISFTSQSPGIAFWGQSQGYVYRMLSPEGINGVKWIATSPAEQDKRLPVTGVDPVRQDKYSNATITMPLADGIQARMIQAEAQLQPPNAPQGPWLTTLNDARATIGMAPLDDPGTAAGRVDLLFTERAFWFYLTGQRLGDLRRLVRFYGRLPMQVYPVGTHPKGDRNAPTYGNEFVFTPRKAEQDYNPLYQGCIDKRP